MARKPVRARARLRAGRHHSPRSAKPSLGVEEAANTFACLAVVTGQSNVVSGSVRSVMDYSGLSRAEGESGKKRHCLDAKGLRPMPGNRGANPALIERQVRNPCGRSTIAENSSRLSCPRKRVLFDSAIEAL